MTTIYGSFGDMLKEIVGGFTMAQMIAIGVVAGLAILLGFFVGGIAFYKSGVKHGRLQGAKDAVMRALQKAEADKTEKVGRVKEALRAEQEKHAAIQAEKDAALKATMEQLEQAEKSKDEAEQAVLAAQKSTEEANTLVVEAQRSREEAEKAAREAEDNLRVVREREAGEEAARARKNRIEVLTKEEILTYAGGLNEYLPASVYERGGEDLPDSCRVGICTFLIVYERKGMVKLILRLHKKTAHTLSKQYKLFGKAAYPKGGDWYKWILSSEVTDPSIVATAIRMAYKYVYLCNYDEQTQETDVAFVNRDEMRINEAILKHQNIPDRDFIVASDAEEGAHAAYRLYGKREMTDYCLSLSEAGYPVSATESESDLSPNTFKVGDKTFMMAYEKDGVAKMVFRLSEEAFALLKRKHATADVSPFPKATGYRWYVATVDQTFASNEDIEEIIRNACAYVHGLNAK